MNLCAIRRTETRILIGPFDNETEAREYAKARLWQVNEDYVVEWIHFEKP